MDENIARLSRIETAAVNFIHQVTSGVLSSTSQSRKVDDFHA